MARFSTGLRNKMLDTNSFDAIMAAGFIKIYSGAEPTDADAAVTGTLLCTISISSGGTGINMAASAAAGVLSKSGGETWSGVNAATGTAGYARHVAAGDTGASSSTEARIQGPCALAGGFINLSSLSLTSGLTTPIDYYNVALPTL
jgi:hypothetical protein